MTLDSEEWNSLFDLLKRFKVKDDNFIFGFHIYSELPEDFRYIMYEKLLDYYRSTNKSYSNPLLYTRQQWEQNMVNYLNENNEQDKK